MSTNTKVNSDINALKLDILQRGITISEQKIVLPPLGQEAIRLVIAKNDTDGLTWNVDNSIAISLYNTEEYLNFLRNGANRIEDFIHNRHRNDPNTCQHKVVNFNGKIRCENCMVNLGDQVVVTVTNN